MPFCSSVKSITPKWFLSKKLHTEPYYDMSKKNNKSLLRPVCHSFHYSALMEQYQPLNGFLNCLYNFSQRCRAKIQFHQQVRRPVWENLFNILNSRARDWSTLRTHNIELNTESLQPLSEQETSSWNGTLVLRQMLNTSGTKLNH